MSAYARHDTGFFSRRAILFIVVVLFHVLLFFVFQSGLATRIAHAVAKPMETTIEQDVKQKDLPPPPPPPKMEHPPVEVPPPDVVINVPVEQTTAITNTTAKVVAAPTAVAPRPDVRTRASLDTAHSPSTDSYYPDSSRRLEETGTVVIDVCLDDAGKMTGPPKVQTTSKSPRLDEAAVRWGSHARFIQGTLNGKPVAGCTAFKVTFKLTGDD